MGKLLLIAAIIAFNSVTFAIDFQINIPPFCKLQMASVENQYQDTEFSVTCNDRDTKYIQVEPLGTLLDTDPNCGQATSSIAIRGMVVNKHYYICNKTSDETVVTLVLGL